jgi:uncharacterized cupin superfamily protein
VIEGEFVLVPAGKPMHMRGPTISRPASVTSDEHHFLNLTEKNAAFLVRRDRTADDEVTYPDIDLKLKAVPDGVRGFRHKDGTPYPRVPRD